MSRDYVVLQHGFLASTRALFQFYLDKAHGLGSAKKLCLLWVGNFGTVLLELYRIMPVVKPKQQEGWVYSMSIRDKKTRFTSSATSGPRPDNCRQCAPK